MPHIDNAAYALDAIGIAGAIIGLYLAGKSKYSNATSKQATSLIEIQDKKITSLEKTIKDLTKEVHNYREDNNKMMGELNAYKKMALVSPDIISKLTSTLDNILQSLSADGIHINNQNVDTQVIKEVK